MVSDELSSGALQVVLPEHIPEELDIYVVFSTRRNMPVRVRALLEFLKAWAAKPPPWALAQPALAPAAVRPASARRKAPVKRASSL
jgi:hypothetical protein